MMSYTKDGWGCGKLSGKGNWEFLCGVANGNGKERLCLNCTIKLKERWFKEDQNRKLLKDQKLKGGIENGKT